MSLRKYLFPVLLLTAVTAISAFADLNEDIRLKLRRLQLHATRMQQESQSIARFVPLFEYGMRTGQSANTITAGLGEMSDHMVKWLYPAKQSAETLKSLQPLLQKKVQEQNFGTDAVELQLIQEFADTCQSLSEAYAEGGRQFRQFHRICTDLKKRFNTPSIGVLTAELVNSYQAVERAAAKYSDLQKQFQKLHDEAQNAARNPSRSVPPPVPTPTSTPSTTPVKPTGPSALPKRVAPKTIQPATTRSGLR